MIFILLTTALNMKFGKFIFHRLLHFRQTLTRDIVGRSVTIVVSQPFYVISARMMAEFVGGEKIYRYQFHLYYLQDILSY